MNHWWNRFTCLLFGTLVLGPSFVLAQVSSVQMCTATPAAPACQAVRGDRMEGWLQQTRSEVMARNGVVSTVQPLAVQAGLRILQQGGNAIDAAVATAAVLNVVEPMSTGIGGDMFAIVYMAKTRELAGLNGSGRSGYDASIDFFTAQGMKAIPTTGVHSVSVPGAVDGWETLLKKYGTMSLAQVLEPAIDYAEK